MQFLLRYVLLSAYRDYTILPNKELYIRANEPYLGGYARSGSTYLPERNLIVPQTYADKAGCRALSEIRMEVCLDQNKSKHKTQQSTNTNKARYVGRFQVDPWNEIMRSGTQQH